MAYMGYGLLQMNKLDILILIIIGLAGFSCFITGFVRSTIGLMAIGGGIFIAGRLWKHLAPLLNNFVKHETNLARLVFTFQHYFTNLARLVHFFNILSLI